MPKWAGIDNPGRSNPVDAHAFMNVACKANQRLHPLDELTDGHAAYVSFPLSQIRDRIDGRLVGNQYDQPPGLATCVRQVETSLQVTFVDFIRGRDQTRQGAAGADQSELVKNLATTVQVDSFFSKIRVTSG